jgi:hypothetical protein
MQIRILPFNLMLIWIHNTGRKLETKGIQGLLIWVYLDLCGTGSGMEKNPDSDPGSGMKIPDYISKSLETIFGVHTLKFFDADLDPGSF